MAPEKIPELVPIGADDLSPRITKVLEAAFSNGWELNPPGATLVLRLGKEGDDQALPFFIGWNLVIDPETRKRSWRFRGARALNGQAMNYRDVLTYLEDPAVIHPEPPENAGSKPDKCKCGSRPPGGAPCHACKLAAKLEAER